MTRASDSEREAAVAHLREAAAEGRLDVEELVDRIDAAYAATTRAELEPLTADLPGPDRGGVRRRRPSAARRASCSASSAAATGRGAGAWPSACAS